jgi:hypothetical protein
MTRNIPYERRPQLHSDESLKSRILKLSSYLSGEGQVARPKTHPGKSLDLRVSRSEILDYGLLNGGTV